MSKSQIISSQISSQIINLDCNHI